MLQKLVMKANSGEDLKCEKEKNLVNKWSKEGSRIHVFQGLFMISSHIFSQFPK